MKDLSVQDLHRRKLRSQLLIFKLTLRALNFCLTQKKPKGLKVAKEDQKADRHDGVRQR